LRGGMNNFGIVTKFTLKLYPQSNVWGGIRVHNESQYEAIKKALFKFEQKSTDTKAETAVSLNYFSGQPNAAVFFFYDAPTPSGVFDDLLEIPAIGGNVSTSSYSDFVQRVSLPSIFADHRAIYNDAPVVRHSPVIFDAFAKLTKFWGDYLYPQDKNVTLSNSLQPFDKNYFSHGSDSAYPPDRSRAIFPTFVTAQWLNASLDGEMANVVRNISDTIRAVALADGQNASHAAKYMNYAVYGTPLEEMYGGNVERLRKIRTAIDPHGVMDLTGGWRF